MYDILNAVLRKITFKIADIEVVVCTVEMLANKCMKHFNLTQSWFTW